MNNLNIKKFPDGFNILPNNSDGEYLIISRKGDKKPFKISVENLSALLGVTAGDIQRIQAVDAGPLPTPDAPNRYMVVTGVGAYTYGGTTIGTNTDGYQTTFWWTGDTWVNNGSVRVKGDIPDLYNESKSYNIGEQVYFENQIWKSTSIISPGENPKNNPTKWGGTPLLNGESPMQESIITALGLPSKLDNTIGLTTGGSTPATQSGVIYIHPFDLEGSNVIEYTLRVSPTVGDFEVILFEKSGDIYTTEVIPHTISTSGNHTFVINRNDISRIGFRALTGKLLVAATGGTGFASISLPTIDPVPSQFSAYSVENVTNSVYSLGLVVKYHIETPKSTLVARVDKLETGEFIDENLESKNIVENLTPLLVDDFSSNKGWVTSFGGLVPNISAGTMKLTLTESQTQYVKIDISGIKNKSYQVKIRYRITGGTTLTAPSIGTNYGSSTSNPSYKILPNSSDWRDEVVFVTPQIGATFIAIGAQNTRNGGGVLEVDSVEFGVNGNIQGDYYPLFNIFHNVPSSTTYLANSINKAGNVYLDPINYEIPAGLEVKSGTNIIGVRGKTTVSMIDTEGSAFSINDLQEQITIKDFVLRGTTPIPTDDITESEIKSKSFVGLANGIKMDGRSKEVIISGLDVHSFSGWGIYTNNTHQVYGRTAKFIANQIRHCGGGLMMDVRSEYHNIIGNSIYNNRVGLWISGGNNIGASNLINANGAGLVLAGGLNNGHGSLSSCTINHNRTYSLFAFDVDYGYDLSGCMLIDGDIYIYNSQGINIHGGQIDGFINMYNERGVNQITDVMFAGGGLSGSTTSLSLKNNRFYNGNDSSAINNNL